MIGALDGVIGDRQLESGEALPRVRARTTWPKATAATGPGTTRAPAAPADVTITAATHALRAFIFAGA